MKNEQLQDLKLFFFVALPTEGFTANISSKPWATAILVLWSVLHIRVAEGVLFWTSGHRSVFYMWYIQYLRG